MPRACDLSGLIFARMLVHLLSAENTRHCRNVCTACPVAQSSCAVTLPNTGTRPGHSQAEDRSSQAQALMQDCQGLSPSTQAMHATSGLLGAHVCGLPAGRTSTSTCAQTVGTMRAACYCGQAPAAKAGSAPPSAQANVWLQKVSSSSPCGAATAGEPQGCCYKDRRGGSDYHIQNLRVLGEQAASRKARRRAPGLQRPQSRGRRLTGRVIKAPSGNTGGAVRAPLPPRPS